MPAPTTSCYRGLFTALLGALLHGCATLTPETFTPQTITCGTMDGLIAVTDSDQRVFGPGFSILPPSGEHWCKGLPVEQGIGFFTTPFIGEYVEKPPTKEQFFHSIVVAAMRVNVKKADISSPSALKAFMERWLKAGQIQKTIGGEIYATLSKSPRFSAISSYVEEEDSLNADCVRFQSEVEERHNSGYPPDWVLVLTNDSIACRHPDSERVIIMVSFSERRRKGQQNPEIIRELRSEANGTFQSLEFSAL